MTKTDRRDIFKQADHVSRGSKVLHSRQSTKQSRRVSGTLSLDSFWKAIDGNEDRN